MASMGQPGMTVRPATSADIKPLAAVLARAFYDDPPFMWLLPEPKSRPVRLRRLFAVILRLEALPHQAVEVACAGDEIVGGAIWMPPGHWLPSVSAQLRALPPYVYTLGRRFGAGAALNRAMARVHPSEPHWYLHAIGVDPGYQGRGVASILIRSRLQRCDQAGQPAYLESSKPANVPLYEHFGFQPTPIPALPDDAPVLTPMWRPPAARAE